jgi:hypothetical protein
LPGTLDGPSDQARQFYRDLSEHFERHLTHALPHLDRAFHEWLDRHLQADLWKDVRLSGFDVQDPSATPTAWDMMFETIGNKWLAITIPFVGDVPQDGVVDT